MNQIRLGLNEVNTLVKASYFGDGRIPDQIVENVIEQLPPDIVNSASLDEHKNRISRSIKLMSQFI
jgi:hypothetical protein